MRKIVLFLLLLIGTGISAQVSIIPQPVELKQQDGSWLLKDKITVSSSFPAQGWQGLFRYFKEEMKKQFNVIVTEAAKGKKGDIDFSLARMPTSGKPAYQLEVNKTGVSIKTNFDEPA